MAQRPSLSQRVQGHSWNGAHFFSSFCLPPFEKYLVTGINTNALSIMSAEWEEKAMASHAFNVEIKILLVCVGDSTCATAGRKQLGGKYLRKGKNVLQSLWDLMCFPWRSYVPSLTAETRKSRWMVFEVFQFKVSGQGTVWGNGFSPSRTNIQHQGLKIVPACTKAPSSLCHFQPPTSSIIVWSALVSLQLLAVDKIAV